MADVDFNDYFEECLLGYPEPSGTVYYVKAGSITLWFTDLKFSLSVLDAHVYRGHERPPSNVKGLLAAPVYGDLFCSTILSLSPFGTTLTLPDDPVPESNPLEPIF